MQNDTSQQPFAQPTHQPQPTPLATPPPPTRRTTKWYASSLFILFMLICIPPLGLIMMWLVSRWKPYIKVLVTIPVAFNIAVFLLIVIGGIQGAITTRETLKNEPVKMERFLKEKYGKNFIVRHGKITQGGDVLFGISFKTYQASVSPVDNPNMVFTASRIVEGESLDGGASSPDTINYSDNYLLQLWTNELQGNVKSVIMSQPIGAFSADFQVALVKNRASIAEFYDTIWGTTPTYDELPLNLKQELSLISNIKALGPVNAHTITAYAATMIAVRNALDPMRENLNIRVDSFKIYHRQGDTTPGWEWQNINFIKLDTVESTDTLTPYFIQWTNGYGKYYDLKTHEFDAS